MKDKLKASLYLKDMGLRTELQLKQSTNNKTCMPLSCFTMIASKKYSFLQVLEGVRVSHGYASNVSHCVKLKERKIMFEDPQ